MQILVLNAGSSSLKFQLFNKNRLKLVCLAKGIADAIALPTGTFKVKVFQAEEKEIVIKPKYRNHHQALTTVLNTLNDLKLLKPQELLIGHRVVHGGEKYHQPILINPKVFNQIDQLSDLAPLHNPINLSVVKSCLEQLPQVKNYAVFDTGFYQTLTPKAYLYALPKRLYQQYGIRKYGFHGISHQYVISRARTWLKSQKKTANNLISCHLGNGCSVTASINGKAVDTSMGYTPLEGCVMGTRSGSLDPAIPLIIAQKSGQSPEQIINLLNKDSGLKAISELSSDLRIIHQAAERGNKQAKLALDIFAYSIAKQIGTLSAALNFKIDALIFTAGIGENAAYLRTMICQYLGISLVKKLNNKNNISIASKSAKFPVLIVPTDEEVAIAEQSSHLK